MAGEMFYTTSKWFSIRMKVLARDHHCCVVCNASVRGKGLARIDHIIARRDNPALEYEMSNLRTLCVQCDRIEQSARNQRPSEKPTVAVGLDGFPLNSEWSR